MPSMAIPIGPPDTSDYVEGDWVGGAKGRMSLLLPASWRNLRCEALSMASKT